jgi:BASS family bile acid:Na+ symporter
MDVKDDAAFRCGKTAKVPKMGIAARLHPNTGCRQAAQVHGHRERRAAIVGERRLHHATMANRDQLRDAAPVAFLDQMHRIGPVRRRFPGGVGAARALFPQGLALMAIMGSMGLQVKFADVVASARQLRLVVLGLVANFVLVPLVTILLLYCFDANAMVSAGFLILAVCPGAPIGPPFTALAKGSVSCALGLMVILAGLSAILAPALLTGLLARLSPQSDLHIDSLAIVRTLLVAQMLPLGIGLGIHHWAPTLARAIDKPVRILGNLLLLIVLVLILAVQYETLSAIRLRGWGGMLLLLMASLGIGWISGGPDRATRKALALTTAARNAAVAYRATLQAPRLSRQ